MCHPHIFIQDPHAGLELNWRTQEQAFQRASFSNQKYLASYILQFEGMFFEKVEGAAMGSPLSPIITNIYYVIL